MSWNYRLIKQDGTIGLHEVYYTDGKPDACTIDPVEILFEESDNLEEILWQITRAFKEPILDMKDF